MTSALSGTNEQSQNTFVQISSQFLNVFGFIEYKADGSLPWTTQDDVLLSDEYVSYTDCLGIDCEMVGVGNFKISALGRVSIVNEHGFCVYDTFVNPEEEITDYCTQYSGIRAENLIDAPSVKLVVQKVASIVKGRVLVGHSIHNDLDVLKLKHPEANIRDTANFFQHKNGNKRTPSLKNLVKDLFDTEIQDAEHSSIQDAQAALGLYLLFREEWEKDALERRRKANLDNTVADITCMHVQPRQSDLSTESESVFSRSIKLVGPYLSSEEYKDHHFRLLLKDVLQPMRQDIRMLKQRRMLNNHFHNIRIVADKSLKEFEVKSYKTLLVPIQRNRLEEIDWDDRNIFLTGSLLILSPDNFHSIKCAKVIDIGHNQTNDSDILRLYVNFLLDGPSWQITNNDRFQMIESKAFFLPYEYTLNFLQDVDLDSFPMKKYIVDAVTKSEIAPNLLKDSVNLIDFSILMNDVNSKANVRAHPLDYQHWPTASQLNLDQSQYEGLQKAITQELTIIQGPPGTGKSYVSLQIVKLLLTNKWLSSSPILIVSYTNHALDELLEPILKFLADEIHGGNLVKAEQSLLRIGGGCESEMILPCTRRYKNEKVKEKNKNKKIIKSLEKALVKVKDLDFTSRLIPRGILNFKLVPQTMLAQLEVNETSKTIFKMWIKSQKEIESNVFSWFGLNDQSMELRPKSLTSISDGLFLLLCNNLEPILSQRFPNIPITLKELKDKSLHNKNMEQQYLIRWGYYFFLIGQLADIVSRTQNELTAAINASTKLEEYVKENAFIKQAKVIGMTTTGAVKYKKMIETKFKSNIMLVEEAAHVLEAYVVASLTRHCTQLILIGDHKQLRPMIADHELSKDFLDVSLMERLVINGTAENYQNWTQLKVQHRMRSDIAKLICPVIYDELENHSDVEKYPNIKGCSKNLFFVHHENLEAMEACSKSRFNAHEAKYIIGLLSYFTECGYLPSQITVICTYLAQKTLIDNTIKNDPNLNQIQISTVDGYQGKQNDLVILSLVRNNHNNDVGFLKTDNRVCVALSRARHGLIMVGNMTILASSSDTWSKINQILTECNSIGTDLPLKHPQMFKSHHTLVNIPAPKSTPVRTRRRRRRSKPKIKTQSNQITSTAVATDNFKKLKCGHTINLRGIAQNSSDGTKCLQKSLKQLQCGHEVTAYCYQLATSLKCQITKIVKLPCGHRASVYCDTSRNVKNVTCRIQETKTLACGHSAKVRCGLNLSEVKCVSKLTEQLPCSHRRHFFCYEKRKKAKCGFVIQKKMQCGHVLPVACHQLSTATCYAKVTQEFPCGHKQQVFCGKLRSNVKCAAIIQNKYPCGHIHRFLCSKGAETTKCNSSIKRKLPCGHVQQSACHQSALSIKCRHLITFMNKNFECHKFEPFEDLISGVQNALAKVQLTG